MIEGPKHDRIQAMAQDIASQAEQEFRTVTP
jgi:hypothetical protein